MLVYKIIVEEDGREETIKARAKNKKSAIKVIKELYNDFRKEGYIDNYRVLIVQRAM